jgi:hypothetical protein
MNNELNDAPVLDVVRDHWQKISALLLHRFALRGELVQFTADDMKKLETDWPEGTIVLCLGTQDAIGLKLVTPAEAEKLKRHNNTLKGSA